METEFPRLLNAENLDAWEDLKSGWMDPYYEPGLEEALESQDTDLIEQTEYLEEFFTSTFPGISFDDVGSVLQEWFDCKVSDNRVSEIQLAWSEYKDGAWTAKKVGEESLSILYRPKESFLLKPEITQSELQRFPASIDDFRLIETSVAEGGELVITCYSSNGPFNTSHCTFHSRNVMAEWS